MTERLLDESNLKKKKQRKEEEEVEEEENRKKRKEDTSIDRTSRLSRSVLTLSFLYDYVALRSDVNMLT